MDSKSLVWLTHSFRKDSRLTSKLNGSCTFVFYSPYYFAGNREKQILKKCSKANLENFYFTLEHFKSVTDQPLYVFKSSDPIEHINYLAQKYGFDKLVIDQPLFAMWHTVDLLKLNIPFEIIDSDLIDDECTKMTAKSRWISHTKKLKDVEFHKWNPAIVTFKINEKTDKYPIHDKVSDFMDVESIVTRAYSIAPTYGQTRDNANGQTQLSTAIQNGIIDPHNIFYSIAKKFENMGCNLQVNEGSHASMLRQFAFREMNIIRSRKNDLTLEDSPINWARTIMHPKAFENLVYCSPDPNSTLTFDKILASNTDSKELNTILRHFNRTGIMPNRARMYFAGKIFYSSKTGLDALNLLIKTFDLIGLDGQCPNNYIQCIDSLGLTYGKVMLLNATRVFELLKYEN